MNISWKQGSELSFAALPKPLPGRYVYARRWIYLRLLGMSPGYILPINGWASRLMEADCRLT